MKPSPAINVLGVGAALGISLWCEWVIARAGGGSILVPPAALLVLILVMATLPFSLRIWCAAGAGFILDSVGLPPFGATIMLLLFLACAIEVARWAIVERASPLAKVAMTAGLYLLAYAVAPLARAAAGLLRF